LNEPALQARESLHLLFGTADGLASAAFVSAGKSFLMSTGLKVELAGATAVLVVLFAMLEFVICKSLFRGFLRIGGHAGGTHAFVPSSPPVMAMNFAIIVFWA
jgi:hypothetical protein